jgi:putative flippase GtrA
MRPGLLPEVARFALVGVVNTLTYYGSYLLLVLALPYLAAHVLAFAISMTGSFLLNCRFTYRTAPTWRKFALFPLTVAANFTITTVGVAVLVELLSVDERVAPLLAAGVAIPLTFLATRAVLVGRTPQAVLADELAETSR